MRAQEFVTEAVHPDVVSKEYFNDPTPNVRMGDFEFNARTFTGAMADPNARGLQIRAYDPKRPKGQNLIGSADFVVKSNKKGNRWLESDDTEVNDEYRGQGVAAMMYAFAKSLGNDIKDSPYKSRAGGDMWHKWGKDARHLVGEQSIAEYKKSREEFEGITIEMVENGHVLVINALDDWGNNVLGSVAFNIGDDNELDPQDLKVDKRYQGQGIARVMYDYVKSLGYTINRSWDQTDAGAGFWNKHRGEDVRVWESFDRPYPVEFEHSEYGDVDALTRLPDGTYLSIMFNQESGHDGTHPGHWSVEFYRNNSQEVTGEGDAQKVFATVIEAIRQFVIKMKPGSISFSASKEPEADMAQPGANVNPESRAKLYNRLVQRYAGSMGYSVQQQEGNGKVTYTLKQARKGVAEEQLDELNFLGSECTKDCSGHRAGYDWSKRKGLRQANSWSPSFNKGAGLAVAGK
jgi:predicted GNAT family acetyltransferase